MSEIYSTTIARKMTNDAKVRLFMEWVQKVYRCPDHPRCPMEIYQTHHGGEWVVGCTGPVSAEGVSLGQYRQGFSSEKKCCYHVHMGEV